MLVGTGQGVYNFERNSLACMTQIFIPKNLFDAIHVAEKEGVGGGCWRIGNIFDPATYSFIQSFYQINSYDVNQQRSI